MPYIPAVGREMSSNLWLACTMVCLPGVTNASVVLVLRAGRSYFTVGQYTLRKMHTNIIIASEEMPHAVILNHAVLYRATQRRSNKDSSEICRPCACK